MPDTQEITRLAVYGTLAPGRENHNQLAPLKGDWQRGAVSGRFVEKGWAVENGYPALVLDSQGSLVDVLVFESADLPEHWARLDEFEGHAYRRVLTEVQLESKTIMAWIYVSAEE